MGETCGVSSPRVPVAIRNNVVSTIAAASDVVTHTTGVFISSLRRGDDRCFEKKLFWKKLDQTGSGIAMLTLIDITVRATIRHSESEPIAREAATALVNRDEATGAAWPSKPAARDDRIMAGKSLKVAGESPAEPASRRNRRQYLGGGDLKMAKQRQRRRLCPLFSVSQASAAMLAESVTPRPGRQSMAT
jgi:hypothetical protein